MFQSIVNRVQQSADSLISKYVTRVIVAVPLLIAVGFGTAAASVALTEAYGSLAAHGVLAATFAVVGLVAAAALAASGGSQPTAAGTEPTESVSAETPNETTGKSAALDPEMLLGAIGAIGPAALPTLVRLLARNAPLIIGVLVLAYLLFSDAGKQNAAGDTSTAV